MKKTLLERLRSARVPVLIGALGAVPVHATLQTVAPGSTEVASSGIGQAFLGMAAVLASIFALSWLAKRFGLQRLTGSGHLVKVVSSTAVGQRERVVVVEVADTWVVLGVTPTQVQALYTLPAQGSGQLGGEGGSAVTVAATAAALAPNVASQEAKASVEPAPSGSDKAPPLPPLTYPPVMAHAASPASDGMDPVMVFARKLHESLVRNTHLSTP
ncbi:flagellar biosynthetic protein FliO [Variovorax dokdonensis]|uniref:Flagellar protein n=1 Tax=Variovorax dokdonensis TaxID=344883 RepID=A0ABT7N4T8_9BURK|nr:flagellar biosynthetic protein FliO [Variovorax dokdonensis]MDM0042957.1 flagellar biosynthetic protein FliO [Variovorax dokdonensis]